MLTAIGNDYGYEHRFARQDKETRIREISDRCIQIPSGSTPKIQEGNILMGHIICGLIEEQMFPRKQ